MTNPRLFRGRVVDVADELVLVRVAEVPAAGASVDHLPGVWVEQVDGDRRFVRFEQQLFLASFAAGGLVPVRGMPVEVLATDGCAPVITSTPETP